MYVIVRWFVYYFIIVSPGPRVIGSCFGFMFDSQGSHCCSIIVTSTAYIWKRFTGFHGYASHYILIPGDLLVNEVDLLHIVLQLLVPLVALGQLRLHLLKRGGHLLL